MDKTWIIDYNADQHSVLEAALSRISQSAIFKCLLRSHGDELSKIVADKLRSYGVAHRELMPDVIHTTCLISPILGSAHHNNSG